MKHKEQECANLEKSAGQLTSDWDTSKAELSAVVQCCARFFVFFFKGALP